MVGRGRSWVTQHSRRGCALKGRGREGPDHLVGCGTVLMARCFVRRRGAGKGARVTPGACACGGAQEASHESRSLPKIAKMDDVTACSPKAPTAIATFLPGTDRTHHASSVGGRWARGKGARVTAGTSGEGGGKRVEGRSEGAVRVVNNPSSFLGGFWIVFLVLYG